MKVTDEMVARYDDGGGADKYDVRAALEVILKDVPEPSKLEARLTALESKLEAVRAWHDSGRHDLKRLRAALDGESLLVILDGK